MYSSSSKSNNESSLPRELREAIDDEPRQLGQELERVWDLTGMALSRDITSPKEEMDDMWINIRSSIDSPAISTPKRRIQPDRAPSKSVRSSSRIKTRWAVSVMAVLLPLIALYWTIPVTIEADRGEISSATLPDGSVVMLNSGSSVTYKRDFDGIPFIPTKERAVNLQGEGYFKVSHSNTPFTVKTFNAEVQVLGTEFNIRSWPEEPEQESTISLMSGRVAVYKTTNPDDRILLEEPGHTVVVGSGKALPDSPEVLNVESVLSWQDRGLLIKSKTLRTVFDELERRYDVTISVEDQKILNDSLTMLFATPEGIESILDGICVERNLKFRRTSRGYVIYRPDS